MHRQFMTTFTYVCLSKSSTVSLYYSVVAIDGITKENLGKVKKQSQSRTKEKTLLRQKQPDKAWKKHFWSTNPYSALILTKKKDREKGREKRSRFPSYFSKEIRNNLTEMNVLCLPCPDRINLISELLKLLENVFLSYKKKFVSQRCTFWCSSDNFFKSILKDIFNLCFFFFFGGEK